MQRMLKTSCRNGANDYCTMKMGGLQRTNTLRSMLTITLYDIEMQKVEAGS
jgi:hypothetical protein